MAQVGWKVVGLGLLLHIAFGRSQAIDNTFESTTIDGTGSTGPGDSTNCHTKRQNLLLMFAQFRRTHPEFTKAEIDERRAMLDEEIRGLACVNNTDSNSSNEETSARGKKQRQGLDVYRPEAMEVLDQRPAQGNGTQVLVLPEVTNHNFALTKDDIQEDELIRAGALGKWEHDANAVLRGIPRPGRYHLRNRFRDKQGNIWGSNRAMEVANSQYLHPPKPLAPENVHASAEPMGPGRWGCLLSPLGFSATAPTLLLLPPPYNTLLLAWRELNLRGSSIVLSQMPMPAESAVGPTSTPGSPSIRRSLGQWETPKVIAQEHRSHFIQQPSLKLNPGIPP